MKIIEENIDDLRWLVAVMEAELIVEETQAEIAQMLMEGVDPFEKLTADKVKDKLVDFFGDFKEEEEFVYYLLADLGFDLEKETAREIFRSLQT